MGDLYESGELELGVLLDGSLQRFFTLRQATLADTYQAAASVPVPDGLAEDQAARVAYQMAIDDAQVLCQLTQLGELVPVPAAAALVAALDPDDMAILRQAAYNLKKKLRLSRLSLRPTGAPNTSSSAPASA